MDHVEFGVMLPNFLNADPPPHSLYHALQYNFKVLDFEAIKNIALEAERLGYHSLWISDHLSYRNRRERLESWTTLSALSSMTERIRLGTIVLCNLYRPPGLTAKMASTLDFISKGRLELGIGACWNDVECSNFGIDFPIPKVRLGMLRESVEIIKMLWTQERTTYRGRYYTLRDAYCEPKPVQKPHPPILIGGGGEQLTLRVVAKHADRSNFGGPPALVKRRMDILRKYCSKQGRDYESIVKSINLSVVVAPTYEDFLSDMRERYLAEGSPGPFREWLKRAGAAYVAGTPEECIKKLRPYVDLGISLFILRFGGVPGTEDLDLFAKEVITEINR